VIPRRCRRCGEPVWVWPWQNAYCRDFERCISSEWAQMVEYEYPTPDWLAQTFEPGPIEFEQPPTDMDLCSQCKGFGSVIRLDWEMGPVYEDCKRCETTGEDPSLCPA